MVILTWSSTRATVGVAVTPTYLVGAGLIAAATALFEILTEVRFVGETTFAGYLEFLLLAVPAVGLVYAGYWLQAGEFHPDDVWRIGVLAVGGTVVAAVVTAGLLFLGPVPAMDASATFVLFVGAGTEGSLLGVLAGALATTDTRVRRERDVADELETLQALLSHDIRNRLTIIGGHLTLAGEAADVPSDAIHTIEAQLEAIESLLADTGEATRALSSEAAAEPVDLAAAVREQVHLIRESYDEVTVRTDLPDAAWVTADELLSSVLDNLLSNAVHHHDGAAPQIEVTVSIVDDHVRLVVADDGPGIPAGRRDEVFEAGVGEGTGMGLYLVETVVEGYGGAVELGANEPRGTVVTITLPRAGR